jgi:hypothetical protein
MRVCKSNEASKLQIGASSDCTKKSAVELSFTPEKIHHSQNLETLILLYGSESWVSTLREEQKLLVFERKVFRTICGPKIKNGVYRRRYHELDIEFVKNMFWTIRNILKEIT